MCLLIKSVGFPIPWCSEGSILDKNTKCYAIKQKRTTLFCPHLLFKRRNEGSALRFLQNPFGTLEKSGTNEDTFNLFFWCMLVYIYMCESLMLVQKKSHLHPANHLNPTAHELEGLQVISQESRAQGGGGRGGLKKKRREKKIAETMEIE